MSGIDLNQRQISKFMDILLALTAGTVSFLWFHINPHDNFQTPAKPIQAMPGWLTW